MILEFIDEDTKNKTSSHFAISYSKAVIAFSGVSFQNRVQDIPIVFLQVQTMHSLRNRIQDHSSMTRCCMHPVKAVFHLACVPMEHRLYFTPPLPPPYSPLPLLNELLSLRRNLKKMSPSNPPLVAIKYKSLQRLSIYLSYCRN